MKVFKRFFSKKAQEFISISFEIITGRTPIDHEKIRSENCKFIFSQVIYWQNEVEIEYDACFKLFHDHEKAKNLTLLNLLKLSEL